MKQSLQEFAASYKARFPQYANVNDQELVKRLMVDHPEIKDHVDIGTTLDSVMTTGLRVGGALVGGGLGTLTDFFTGPVGTMAGGALGAAAGETAAEAWEKYRGLRSGINPTQIATQGAIGAIPLAKVAQGARPLIAAGVHGLQGAALGAGADVATNLAETGELPSLGEVGKSALLGGAFGGTVGGLMARRARNVAGTPSVIPEMEALRQQQAAAARTLNPTVLDKAKALPGNLIRDFVDQFQPVRATENALQRAGKVSYPRWMRPSDVLDREFGGAGGLLEEHGDALKQLYAGTQADQLEQPVRDFLNLSASDHAARNLMKQAQTMLADPDPAIQRKGADLMRELVGGQALPQQLTPGLVKQRLADLEQSLTPNQWQKVTGHGKRVFDLNRHTLDRLHGEGIVGPDAYRNMVGSGHDYVPMLRIIRDAEQEGPAFGALDLKSQRVLYKLTGSEKDTMDPWLASLSRGQEAIREMSRNRMAKAMTHFGSVDNSFRVLQPHETPGAGMGEIGYFESGQKVRYQVPKPIADVFNTEHAQGLPGIAVLRATQNVAQQFMTSLNPAFSFGNIIKDVYDARALSPVMTRTNVAQPSTWIKGPADLAKFMVEWGQAWKQTIMKDPEFLRFQRAGADYSTLQKSITPEDFYGGSFDPSLLKRAKLGMEKFSNANETATKLATFNRAVKVMPDEMAASLTRNLGGSPDFAKRGLKSGNTNALFTFFNAQMQGLNRNAKFFFKDPARMLNVVATATVSAAALDAYNRQYVDPDGTPAMARVSDQERQSNWIVIRPETYITSEGIERHRFLKVPKGHIARLISNPIEHAVESVGGVQGMQQFAKSGQLPKDATPQNAYQVALDFVGNMIPGSFNLKAGGVVGSVKRGAVSSLNPALKTPIEWATNEDSYRNIPIEAKRLQGIAVPERYTPTTSPTMRGASKTLENLGGLATTFGASPQQLQHAMANFVPGPGEMALSAADQLAGKDFLPNRGALQGDERLSRMPVAGPLLRRVVGSSLDQVSSDAEKRIYDALARAEQTTKTFRTLIERSPAEAQMFMKDPQNQKLMGLNKALTQQAQVLAMLRKQKERILRSSDPNAAQLLQQAGQMESNLVKKLDALIATQLQLTDQ